MVLLSLIVLNVIVTNYDLCFFARKTDGAECMYTIPFIGIHARMTYPKQVHGLHRTTKFWLQYNKLKKELKEFLKRFFPEIKELVDKVYK